VEVRAVLASNNLSLRILEGNPQLIAKFSGGAVVSTFAEKTASFDFDTL
jgi:hypothetical protein